MNKSNISYTYELKIDQNKKIIDLLDITKDFEIFDGICNDYLKHGNNFIFLFYGEINKNFLSVRSRINKENICLYLLDSTYKYPIGNKYILNLTEDFQTNYTLLSITKLTKSVTMPCAYSSVKIPQLGTKIVDIISYTDTLKNQRISQITFKKHGTLLFNQKTEKLKHIPHDKKIKRIIQYSDIVIRCVA